MYSLKQILILDCMISNNINKKANAIKVDALLNLINRNTGKVGTISRSTVKRGIDKLVEDGLVEYGFMHGRSKTYYATELAEEFINDAMGDGEIC